MLPQHESHFRLLVESIQDYEIITLDLQGSILSWNAGGENLRGYTAPAIVGQHFCCLFTAEDIQKGQPQEALAIASAKGRWEADGWQVRQDGSQFWANVVITPLQDQQGQLNGFCQVTRDNSVSKQLESQLAKQQEVEIKIQENFDLLKVVIEGTSDLIFVKNLRGEYVLINPAFAQAMGRSPEEILGRNDLAFFPPDTANQVMALDQSLMANGVSKTLEEYVPFNGEIRTFMTTKTPYRDPQGNITGLIGITRDITEQQAALRDRQQAEVIMRQSEQRYRSLT